MPSTTDRDLAELTASSAALDALRQLSEAIATDLNPVQIARMAVSHARALLPADAAHLWVWDPNTEVLRCVARDETVAPLLVEWTARPGESIVGNVFANRQPLLVEDYPNWAHAWPEVVKAGVRTALGVALLVKDRPVGAIVVHNYAPRPFDEQQTRLLAMFAAQVGPAIEVARLYEESEQRRAEAEAVNSSLAEGVCTLDTQGRVRFMNPMAEQLLGWSQADLEHRSLHAAVHFQAAGSGSLPDTDCPILRCLQSGEVIREEDDTFTTKQGRVIPVSWSSSPILLRGQTTGLVLAFRDISARKANEAKIRAFNDELEQHVVERTAELEAANKELESFAYSVSHDLRAPLRAIDGFSRILITSLHEQLNEQTRDYLERISAASQRMGQLIDDLLNLSRITRTELRFETVDLSSLLRSIASELTAAESGREVEFAIQDSVSVRGDARLLRAALENLLRNAWKFTSKKPSARIVFTQERIHNQPVYVVRDDGAGFDMAYADKLFGAFQRLHSPAEFEGTGIGLATVQRIIQRHNGTIWAEGVVGQGAAFYFTLRTRERKAHGTGE